MASKAKCNMININISTALIKDVTNTVQIRQNTCRKKLLYQLIWTMLAICGNLKICNIEETGSKEWKSKNLHSFNLTSTFSSHLPVYVINSCYRLFDIINACTFSSWYSLTCGWNSAPHVLHLLTILCLLDQRSRGIELLACGLAESLFAITNFF